jgi:hypothetical protein
MILLNQKGSLQSQGAFLIYSTAVKLLKGGLWIMIHALGITAMSLIQYQEIRTGWQCR